MPRHRTIATFGWAVLAAALSLGGCAAQPSAKAESAPLASDQHAAATAQLTVESSQGSQTLKPTVVGYPEAEFSDPLEWLNRPIFTFNDVLYRYALIPLGRGYQTVVPSPVRTVVSNFFGNLREPISALNQLFQLEGREMGGSLARFAINTTIGVLGLFDPATSWFELERRTAHINDTLAHYGVGYGAYLVLPILGPTDLRNGFSTLTEGSVHPIRYLTDDPETLYIQGYEVFHTFAPTGERYQLLRKDKEDPYRFFRNLYLQGVLRDEQFPQP